MCCSRKQKTNTQREEINKLGELTRLTETELIELKTRFARMSQGSNFVTKFQFRDNLGLLGMGTMLHLSDRIFHIMDDDKDGKIRFEDFALYFDKVSHGDAREKAEISFKLIDTIIKFKYYNYLLYYLFNKLEKQSLYLQEQGWKLYFL